MVRKTSARTRILEATEQILERDGVLALTTNRVADESGVNISSLYRHFDNKVEILAELFSSMESERVEFFRKNPIQAGSVEEWDSWLSFIIDSMEAFRQARPALRELRAAVPIYPELRALDRASAKKAAETLMEPFSPLADEDEKRLKHLLMMGSEILSMVLDDSVGNGEERQLNVDTLRTLLRNSYAYVASLTVTRD